MSTEPVFSFEVPPDGPREMEAISELATTVDRVRAGSEKVAHRHHRLKKTVDKLAADHAALRRHVQKTTRSRGDVPQSVRWDVLDREAADAVWTWLIDRVQWLVERYNLHEELGDCWPQHPALVEELTALCLAWHAAYDGGTGDAPLRWHEAFERARRRWRDWDRHTKCRLGQHNDPPATATWSPDWPQRARDVARRDVNGRPHPADKSKRKQVSA